MSPRFALVIFILCECALNALWIHRNQAPPRMYDDAGYLAESVGLFRTLQDRGLASFVAESLLPARGSHPPMAKLVPVPIYFALEPSFRSALYAFTLLIPVFCIYLFLLARALLQSERAALLAVGVTCLFPLTYGMWRHAMAEFGTAVAAVAAVYHLYRSDGFRDASHALLFGLFAGWGLLWKVSFPIFLLGPLVYTLARRAPAARNLLLSLGAAGAIAGPFYWKSWRPVVDFALGAARADIYELWTLGPVLSPVTVGRYWLSIINDGIASYFFVLLCGLLALRRPSWKPQARWLLASWFVPAFLFFSFQAIKEVRYLLPAMPAVGILVAAFLDAVRTPLRVAAMALYPAYLFTVLSFDLLPRRDLRLGPLVFSVGNPELASLQYMPLYSFPANPTRWPTREVVELVTLNAADIRDRAPRLRIVGENPYFSGAVLYYESILNRTPVLTNGPFQRGFSTRWDFLLVLCGPESVYGPLDFREPYLEKLLASRRLPFVELARLPLPRGCDATLYRLAPNQPTERPGSLLEEAEFSGGSVRLRHIFIPGPGAALEARAAPSTCRWNYQVAAREFEDGHELQRLVSRTIGPGSSQDENVSLDLFRGKIIEILLSSASEPAGCRAGWTSIRLIYR